MTFYIEMIWNLSLALKHIILRNSSKDLKPEITYKGDLLNPRLLECS